MPARAISTDDLREIYEIEERDELDDRLHDTVRKNVENFNKFRASRSLHYHSVNMEAFETAVKFVDDFYARKGVVTEKRVIIDSGCGQGVSSEFISNLYGDLPCIGIDRAQSRLKSNKSFEKVSTAGEKSSRKDNLLLLRADLIDFWLMVVDKADWIIEKHFIFHPNPSPKHKDLRQRFYGKIKRLHCIRGFMNDSHVSFFCVANAIFPIFPLLGGDIYLRSNWRTYTQEFRASFEILQSCPGFEHLGDVHIPDVVPHDNSLIITHFDKKYAQVGIPMYDFKLSIPKTTLQQRQQWLNSFQTVQDKRIQDWLDSL
jgi:tRNA G46 methylase TrmB